MDFRYSSEDLALQEEVRRFVKENWDPGPFNAHTMNVWSYDFDSAESRERDKEFIKKIIARGWWIMHWPKEFGGREAPISTQVAYREQMAYLGAPAALGGGLSTPPIVIHGNDYQKRFFLSRLATNEIDIAQGFSEPNAGTDLASLQTRAVVDGDDFVVTGQKIWSSGSHFANWYAVLVRTDPNAPKHRGISYLLMPLKDEQGVQTPGVTLRPLYDFFGRRRWNEVFMDGVRVPRRNLVGELNRGWYVAMTGLNFERTGIETPARLLGILDRFVDLCRTMKFNGTPILANPLVRHKLADLRVLIESDRLMALRVASIQAQGGEAEREGLMSGYRGLVLAKFHFWPTLAHIIGEYAALLQGETRAPHRGMYGTNYALSMPTGFGGGGGILLSPGRIAQRALGLPR